MSPSQTENLDFSAVRVDARSEIPAPRKGVVDVGILDMNHGFPNIGHDAIVTAVRNVGAEIADSAARTVTLRVISLAVRDGHVVPDAGRFGLLIGTGGPGHIDPRRNTAEAEDTIVEDPAWEKPLFALFDATRDSTDGAIIGVCHTYGILCRWAGVAEPELRDRVSGGKSIGVRTTVLTEAALEHPWFAQMRADLGGARTFPVVDSRYYDLVPTGATRGGVTTLGFEAGPGGAPARALTMVEFARGTDGSVPRIFGCNHHPELPSSDALEATLRAKLDAGEITPEIFRSRSAILEDLRRPESDEAARLVGRAYTFTNLIRRHLERLIEG